MEVSNVFERLSHCNQFKHIFRDVLFVCVVSFSSCLTKNILQACDFIDYIFHCQQVKKNMRTKLNLVLKYKISQFLQRSESIHCVVE